MTKTAQYLKLMLEQNQEVFSRFKKIHELYTSDPKSNQDEFNKVGYEIQDVIRRFENILCGHSEGSGYGKYSANLADKFHQEIKKIYPKIDFIGVLS